MLTKLCLIIDSETIPFYEASFAANTEFPVYKILANNLTVVVAMPKWWLRWWRGNH